MNILFLGKPGSGKGSISQRLINDSCIQLSTGDLLRKEENTNSDLGREIAIQLAGGNFATDQQIASLVTAFLNENVDKSIIFDGYPRNLNQAKSCFDSGIFFDRVFLIDVPDDKIKDRIVNRRVHVPSGRVYNTLTLPPKVDGIDDITGEPLTHRKDDRLEVIKQRLENYRNLTFPIIEYLKEKEIEVIVIDGTMPLSEQVNLVNSHLPLTSKKLKM